MSSLTNPMTPEFVQTQAQLAEVLSARMGASITVRTIRRHLARSRNPGHDGPLPPVPTADGMLDVTGWLRYLAAVDYKWEEAEHNESLSPRPPPSRVTGEITQMDHWLDIILHPGVPEADRQRHTFDAIVWVISKLIGAHTGGRPASGPAMGTAKYDRMSASIMEQAIEALAFLDARGRRLQAKAKREMLTVLIVNATDNLVVTPDGRGIISAMS